MISCMHRMDTLGKHFRILAKAAFEKHGFAQAELLSQWAVIVGDDVAAISRPEKIQWPRKGTESARTGGTLVIRAAAGRSLDLHYKMPKMINQINQFFGYEAVVAIKVLAAAGGIEKPVPTPAVSIDTATIRPQLSGIEDEALQDALARLGARVTMKPASPHKP
jgi:hypothetical protein